jgi:type II secretory pathway pseudopilin PulG
MTLLEVLIALFILGVTTSAIVGVIVSGDRIAGRRTSLSYATTIAKNEVERIRSAQTALVLLADTQYSDTVNGIEFEVSRINIPNDSLLADTVSLCREYTVSVTRQPGPEVSVTFRLLQEFNGSVIR